MLYMLVAQRSPPQQASLLWRFNDSHTKYIYMYSQFNLKFGTHLRYRQQNL